MGSAERVRDLGIFSPSTGLAKSATFLLFPPGGCDRCIAGASAMCRSPFLPHPASTVAACFQVSRQAHESAEGRRLSCRDRAPEQAGLLLRQCGKKKTVRSLGGE